MLERVFWCMLFLVMPTTIHLKVCFGSFLPAPIKSGVRAFDRTYNRRPWLPSVACGLFAALAAALKGYSEPAFVFCAGVAVLLFILDTIGAALSMGAKVSKRR